MSRKRIRNRCLGLVLAIAAINALCWAFLTPPFHGPDEHGHIAYVQYLAETGKLPGSKERKQFSTEQDIAMDVMNYESVQRHLLERPPFDRQVYRNWIEAASSFNRDQRADGGGGTFATPNPPLFHAAQSLVYRVAGGDIFNRIVAMRLLAALLFMGSVAFTWALAGELFGPRLWPRVLASLVVALLPMVTYVLTSVHPDTLLTFLYSGAIYFGVRLLKRKPTAGDLYVMSGFVGLALMTKLVAPALLPAVLFAFIATAWRARNLWTKPQMVRNFAISTALVTVPLLIWSVVYPMLGQDAISRTVVQIVGNDGKGGSIGNFFSYLWQWYLPKLPFMETFPQTLGVPAYDTLLRGFWGAFGPWLLLDYPGWLKACLAAFTVGIAVAATTTLVKRRGRLLAQWQPIIFLALIAFSLLFTANFVSYRAALMDEPFFQTRYLFPLISLFGAVVVTAVLAFKRKFLLIASSLVVGALFTLDVAALAINADRYYVEPNTSLSPAKLGEIFHRAAQFGASWEGAWLYWLLFAALLTVPILMVLTLARAFSVDKAYENAASDQYQHLRNTEK